MGQRVDFRSKESVAGAYENEGYPNFLLLHGQEIFGKYAGGAMDDGAAKLDQYLEEIKESGTGAEFCLRVFPDTVKTITKKIEPERAMRFVLTSAMTSNVISDGKGGVIVLQAPGQPAYQQKQQIAGPVMNPVNSAQEDRIRSLENQVSNERELRHKAEMAALEHRFNAQIAGLANQTPAEKQWPDRLTDLLENLIVKPDIAMGWKALFTGGGQDFRTPPAGQQYQQHQHLAGTNVIEEDPMKQAQTTDTQESEIFLLEFLTPEEQALKESKRNTALLNRLNALLVRPGAGAQEGEDGFDEDAPGYVQNGEFAVEDVTNLCIENLSNRGFNKALVATFFLIIQAKDDEDINKLFGHLF